MGGDFRNLPSLQFKLSGVLELVFLCISLAIAKVQAPLAQEVTQSGVTDGFIFFVGFFPESLGWSGGRKEERSGQGGGQPMAVHFNDFTRIVKAGSREAGKGACSL